MEKKNNNNNINKNLHDKLWANKHQCQQMNYSYNTNFEVVHWADANISIKQTYGHFHFATIKYLCQRWYPWTDASFTLHLSNSASYSHFPGHQDSQVGKISNISHVSEHELDLIEITVIDNFKVSPPRIAPKNRPSGFNANLHCHKFKEHEDVS